MSKKNRSKDDDYVARGATLYTRNREERRKKNRERVDLSRIKPTVSTRAHDVQYEDDVIKYLESAGIEVASYKKRYILRRLRVRMGRLKIDSYRDYLNYLKRSPLEIEEIQRSLSINVTRFFRNRDTFEKLGKDILPQMARDKKTIKIWSAGCAVGAEPYTVAMIASETVPKSTNISILATDVKEELLRIARNSTYSEGYLAEMKDSEIPKFFIQTTEGDFKVKPHIKGMVTFNRHDLMKDEYPRNMDLIICRNVLIYVDRKAQNIILNKFLGSLKPDGLLVLGRTETLFGDFRKSVDIVSTKHRIYRKKSQGFQEISYEDPVSKITRKIRKHSSEEFKTDIRDGYTSTTDRLEELRNFRKTFEERKKVWEERLDRSRRERELQRRKVERERKTQDTRRTITTTVRTPRRGTRPTRKEIEDVKQTGSLSDYRSLLKQSSEPIRISRVRRDLDDSD